MSFGALERLFQTIDEPLIAQEVTSQIQIAIVNENAFLQFKQCFVKVVHLLNLVAIRTPDETTAEIPRFHSRRDVEGCVMERTLHNISFMQEDFAV